MPFLPGSSGRLPSAVRLVIVRHPQFTPDAMLYAGCYPLFPHLSPCPWRIDIELNPPCLPSVSRRASLLALNDHLPLNPGRCEIESFHIERRGWSGRYCAELSPARSCTVLQNATGVTVAKLTKQNVTSCDANYEPGGRRFESSREAPRKSTSRVGAVCLVTPQSEKHCTLKDETIAILGLAQPV
jgi:hypothetical protein